jgi:hypothetical protein
MGLDMYLTAKRYIWFSEQDVAAAVAKLFPELKDRKVKQVEAEAAYWRKANAVHKWFVDNVQKGVDDCGDYAVSREQLAELRDTCRRVLDFRHLAVEQLPPADGFFFGSTEVGEWYWQDIENTIAMINGVLADFPEGNWEFEYHASW